MKKKLFETKCGRINDKKRHKLEDAYFYFLSCTMKPVYSCTMFVRFRKLKTNENYNDKLRENHQTSKKRNDNLRLCPYNVNDCNGVQVALNIGNRFTRNARFNSCSDYCTESIT